MTDYAHGKICYIDFPATNPQTSADFYHRVFGWKIRTRGDGSIAFDDGVHQVSGTWSTGRQPSSEPGMLLYIMVVNIDESVKAVIAHGGEIVQSVVADLPETTARFRDPGGNIVGLYQEPTLAR